MRSLVRSLSIVAIAFGFGAMVASAAEPNVVLVGSITGAINPITERYVDRIIDEGEQRGVAAIVFQIDTPGGLIDSTYNITGRMLTARVPIVTYVAPTGARAASAGTFITLAGNIAAMAPSTNIGAAHPVDSSGNDLQGDLRTKAENDAVAHIVNIANARGHNAQWAEQAVRNSVSIGVDEAVRIGVADVAASDVPDLLAKIDGRSVTTAAGPVTLATKGATIEDSDPNPFENLLHLVVDPQVAVLLFTIGTYGIIFELSNPSLLFPGIIGVIAVVLALFAFGTLDANATGVALMLFAVVLFVLELKLPSHGILTVGGIVAMLMGTIIVFPPLRAVFPGIRNTVEPAVIASTVGVTALFFIVVARFALAHRGSYLLPEGARLVGATGVAKSEIGPSGVAHVGGEDWTVLSEGAAIPKGERVRVKRVDNLRLIVERASDASEGGGG